MPRVKLVGVYDANPDAAAETASQYGGKVFASIDDIAREAKAVTVAVPTTFHQTASEPLIRAKVACLIEKPLAKNSTEGRQIVALAKEHGTVLQVGHIERFNPVVRAMTDLEFHPRFIEVTRVSPMTFRSIDVGVVLDIMIHDIDIVLRLARSPVASVEATGVNVLADVEDICNARVTFQSGCVANITASRLAMKTERKLRVFSPEAYVSIDYQKRYGIVVRKGQNIQNIRDVVAKIRSGEIEDLSQVNYQELVDIQELQIEEVEPLRAQLEAFIDAVEGKCEPVVSGEDGLAAVELAEQIVAKIPRGQI